MTHKPLSWYYDIGMFGINRPINDIPEHNIRGSCIHKTSFCDDTCYNLKLYKLNKTMKDKDVKDEKFWQSLPTTYDIHNKSLSRIVMQIQRAKKQTERARFMTRGEGIKDIQDIFRIKVICKATPNTTWWLPTRAWRNTKLKSLIEEILFPIKNLSICASIDPTTTKEEEQMLIDDKWSTMFYGDDHKTTMSDNTRQFKCPKTHKKIKGHCGICKAGCFGQRVIDRQTHVHLSQH